jgi:hypothetical protein
MCLACLEAELWLAYQEDLAAREKAAADAATAAPADPAKPQTPPHRPAAPFACEEPPST